MKKEEQGALQRRVGIFVGLSLLALLGAVFLVGSSSSLFARKVKLVTRFANISGLVVGAPVRLAGVDVGIVQRIRFDRDLKVKSVEVVLGVDGRYMDRIREDSVATLTSKGLLGDMIINITVGSEGKRELKDGDELTAQETEGLNEVMASVHDTIDHVRNLTAQVSKQLQTVLTPEVAYDVARITHSTADLMQHVEKGDGLVHALIYDERMSRYVDDLVREAGGAVMHLDEAVARADELLAAVQHGDGTVHALVYGKDGAATMRELKRTSTELADVVAEIQKGHGLLHSLVYEEDRTNLLQNLTAMSRILRGIAEDVDRGKGTVGALLKDPSVYEDLKTILGNIKRNELLRTLVRYTIKKDGLSDRGAPKKPEPDDGH